MDPESLTALQRLAAGEVGIPAELADRIGGGTLSEMKADAKRLARDLGLVERQPRLTDGRFTNFSDEIRYRAGHAPAEPPLPPVGDIGVGRGGSATPRTPPAIGMTALIRAAQQGRRAVAHQFAEQIAVEELS